MFSVHTIHTTFNPFRVGAPSFALPQLFYFKPLRGYESLRHMGTPKGLNLNNRVNRLPARTLKGFNIIRNNVLPHNQSHASLNKAYIHL